MARLIVDGPDLVVGLSWLEKLGAFHRDVRVPLRAVRSVAAEPRPWYAVRGIRLIGTGFPGVIALGTRLRKDGRDFTAIEPGRPAIRVELSEESPFGQLIVSVRDADATLAVIHGATGL
jgi:hypothetical protein